MIHCSEERLLQKYRKCRLNVFFLGCERRNKYFYKNVCFHGGEKNDLMETHVALGVTIHAKATRSFHIENLLGGSHL